MDKVYEIDCKLGMYEFLDIVNLIADDYFNSEDGTYQPHIGMINAMRLFYNICVASGKFDEKYGHDVISANDMADIISDPDFVEEFNKAIKVESYGFELDFATAFSYAMKIVDNKRSSLGGAVEIIGALISSLSNDVAPLLTEENIGRLTSIAEAAKSGNLSFENILSSLEDNDENVIPFRKE